MKQSVRPFSFFHPIAWDIETWSLGGGYKQARGSFCLGHHQDLVPVADAVGVQRPRAVLHLLWAEHAAKVLVDVVDPHVVGGQLDHLLQLLLQFRHRLVQAHVHLERQVQNIGILLKNAILRFYQCFHCFWFHCESNLKSEQQ